MTDDWTDVNARGDLDMRKVVEQVRHMRPVLPLDPKARAPFAADGLTRLRAISDELALFDSVDDRRRVIRRTIEDRQTITNGAVAFRDQTAEADRLLTLIEQYAIGCKTEARGIRRSIRSETMTQREEERTQHSAQVTERRARGLRDTLGYAGIPEGMTNPSRYEVKPNGIHAIKVDRDEGEVVATQLSLLPIVPISVGHDIDTGQHVTTVAYQDGRGQWHEITVPRGELENSRRLINLQDRGVEVPNGAAGPLADAMQAIRVHNADAIPSIETVSRCGWLPGGRGLQWGRETIGPATCQMQALTGYGSTADAYHARGTWDGWCDAWRWMSAHPIPTLMAYAAAASPLLSLVDCPGYTADFSCEKGRGKTVALYWAMSVWGDPTYGSVLKRDWNVKAYHAGLDAGFARHLPVYRDETKLRRSDADLTEILYQQANGTGRTQGTRDGGIRERSDWHGVMISTGEARVTSYVRGGEGANARALCVEGDVFGGVPTTEAVAALEGARAHYGHLGPAIVRWVIEHDPDGAWLRERYALHRRTLTAEHGGEAAARHVMYVASLMIAADVIHGRLGVPLPARDPWEAVSESIVDSVEATDLATQALESVAAWLAANSRALYGGSSTQPPYGGWLGVRLSDGDVAVVPDQLHRHLDAQGYDRGSFLAKARAQGWIRPDGRHLTRKVTIDGERARLYWMRSSALWPD